ncbi:MAG: hypothetical protein RBR02_10130 [Desulfuromonadaceae bacterium]|nr:hypothetical protein [Desulfuromonadaceae bacterium]
MSKYTWVFIMVLTISFTVLLANSVEIAYSEGTSVDVTLPDDNLVSAFGLLQTMFRLLTFRLYGVPTFLNVLLFIPFGFVAIFMLASWVRGTD